MSALLAGQTTEDTEHAAALKKAVEPNRVRAAFLRFLALGGDEFAPIHEAGVELHNALIDSKIEPPDRTIDLRGAKCVGRLALLNCFVDGALTIEDATLGVLVLQGSRVANGINAGRAKFSGSAFLEKCFVDAREVNFRGAEIGGSLQCTGAELSGNLDCTRAKISGNILCNDAKICGTLWCSGAEIGGSIQCGGAKIIPKNGKDGLICTGAKIGGNVVLNADFECKGRVFFSRARIGGDLDCCGGTFGGADGFAIPPAPLSRVMSRSHPFPGKDKEPDVRFEAKGSVSFVSADIGRSLRCSGATVQMSPRDRAVLDFSRAKIKGDVYFWGASIRNENENGKGQAINAQNAKVDGSFNFRGGFVAKGEVSLYGADISKDLIFSGGKFENPSGFAIMADG